MEHLKLGFARIMFEFGYIVFRWFKITPKYSYLSLRKLFYTSNGEFNKKMSARISKKSINYDFGNEPKGILGQLSSHKIKTIIDEINENGYYVFENKISDEPLKNLLHFSLNTKAKLMPSENLAFQFYDRSQPKAIKYQFQEDDLINNETIQSLAADKTILSIAQAFLGSIPILDLISMWWSTSISKTASSKIAQLYHFDMERIKFIKFFIYLTDVDEDTGPHCYVKGSTKNIPISVRKDGRISDEEILNAYGKENLIEIGGRAGTILAVDTSGFHKGKKLEKNDRLLLQFEFTNSLFGVKNSHHKIFNANETFLKSMNQFKKVYQRYSIK